MAEQTGPIMSEQTEPILDGIEDVNASTTKKWSKQWFSRVLKGYVLVKRNFFTGEISAVVTNIDIPAEQQLKNNSNSYVSNFQLRKSYERKYYTLSEISDLELDSLSVYYSRTSREKLLEVVELEKKYRDFLLKKFAGDTTSYISAIKKREFMDDPDLIRELGIGRLTDKIELISDPVFQLYRRSYAKTVVNIPKKRAKLGLKLRFPFQEVMLISTAQTRLNTTKVTVGVERPISYDIDPIISVCDPKTYVEKLQGANYGLDEEKLYADLLVSLRKIYYNYFSTRGLQNVSNLQSKVKTDPDVLWEVAKLGMKFGVQFDEIKVETYDSPEVLAANDRKKAIEIETQAETDKLDKLSQKGLSPQFAYLVGNGRGVQGGSGMNMQDAVSAMTGMFFMDRLTGGNMFGQQQPQNGPAPTNIPTASGMSIQYLCNQGICDENGNIDFDAIEYILSLRGIAADSATSEQISSVNGYEITRDEAFKVKVFQKNKTK